MRLILSRKGFDSSAGGCPSPIFPDGTLYPLPIPDSNSHIQYDQIQHGGTDIGELVSDLTRGRYTGEQTAHLDPDMYPDALRRSPEWRPLLGQTGAAQGHLRRQAVQAGDLFLFFGLFRQVERRQGHWQFVKKTPARHILWGWMAIGDIEKVDELTETGLRWARYHPHFQIGPDHTNTLYLAADQFKLPRAKQVLPGAGIFPSVSPRLVLTAPGSSKPSLWRLPAFWFPFPDRAPLSYHTKPGRWQADGITRKRGFCQLQSAARGQEFVLDADQYPECRQWISGLIRQFGKTTVGV